MPKMNINPNGKNFKAKNPMQTFKRILGYLKDYNAKLLVWLICMPFYALCNVGGMVTMS
ncbi:MAG: hypothetical protein HDT36_04120, partial [Clostridiales bacterium]|nr:hypothetical protein [Clostridiales bacterium]